MLYVLLYVSLFLFVAGVVMFFILGSKAQVGGGCGFDDLPLGLKISIASIICGIVLFIIWALVYFFYVFLA